MSLTDPLRESDLFAHFDAPDLDSLAATASPGTLAAGAGLDEPPGVHFLSTGRVAMRRLTPYGPFVLRRLGDSSLLGEIRLLGLPPGDSEVVAETESRYLTLDQEALDALSEASPRFQLNLLWSVWKSLSSKLRRTNERLVEFFTPDGPGTGESRPSRGEPAAEFRIDLDAKRGLFAEQRLSSLEINFLSTLSREERYPQGEAIFHEGEPADSMYVVLDGKIRISKHIRGVGEEALSFLERGAYFGEMALIEDKPRSASAMAHDGDAVVLALPREVIGGLLDIRKVSSPRLLRLLSEMLARRLGELDDKLVGWHVMSAGATPPAPD